MSFVTIIITKIAYGRKIIRIMMTTRNLTMTNTASNELLANDVFNSMH